MEYQENDKELKTTLINMFLHVAQQSEKLLKYMSIEEIEEKLNANIDVVKFGRINGFVEGGAYIPEEKTVVLMPGPKGIDQMLIMHELFHALTVGEWDFENWYLGIMEVNENDSWGRGINEGITQVLTKDICPDKFYEEKKANLKKKSTGILASIGFNPFDESIDKFTYAVEQLIVKELMIACGEDTVLKAYFENDPQYIVSAFKELGVKNPQETYDDLRDSLDAVHELCFHISPIERINEFTGKFDKNAQEQVVNALKNNFYTTQEIIINSILKPDMEKAFESKDFNKLEKVLYKLEDLQRLNAGLDGKNAFADIITEFNRKSKEVGCIKIKLKRENLKEFLYRKIEQKKNKKEIDRIVDEYENMLGTLPDIFSEIKRWSKDANSVTMVEQIRGGKNEKEYEEELEKSSNAWKDEKAKRSDKEEKGNDLVR